MASGSLGSLYVSLTANIAEFVRDMGKAAHEAEINMRKIRRELSDVAEGLVQMGLIATTSFAVVTKLAINHAEEMRKMSESTGIGVEALSELAYAARLSNVDSQALGVALGRLSKGILEAASDTGEARAAFTALGLSVKDNSGNMKNANVVFREIADKFAGMQDGAGKAGLAMAIFGRGGAALIPVLNQGSAGLAELGAEAKALGITLTDEASRAAEVFNDNLTKIKNSAEALSLSIAGPLIEKINQLTNQFIEARKQGMSFWDSLSIASAAETEGQRIFRLRQELEALEKLALEFATPTVGNAISNALFGHLDQVQRGIEEKKKEIAFLETLQASTHPFVELQKGKTAAPTLVDPEAAKKAGSALLDFQRSLAMGAVKIYKQSLDQKQALLDFAYADNRISDATYYADKLAIEKSSYEETKKVLEQVAREQEAAAGKEKKYSAEQFNADKKAAETRSQIQEATQNYNKVVSATFENASLAARAYQRSIEGVSIEILRMQGQTAAAAAQQFELAHRDFRKKAEAQNDPAAINELNTLQGLIAAQELFNEERAKLARINADVAAKESLIQKAVRDRQMTQGDGLREIQKLRAESLPDQEAVIDMLNRTAESSGNANLRLQAQLVTTDMVLGSVNQMGQAEAQSLMTIAELEAASYEQRLMNLRDYLATAAIDRETAMGIRVRFEEEHEANLGSFSAQAAVDRAKFQTMTAKDQAKDMIGIVTNLTSTLAAKNRAWFELNKVASIANAIIYTYEGANKALSMGPWGIPLAAVIVAAGLANVAKIASTTFGSGAPSTPNVPGATPVTQAGSVSNASGGSSNQTTIINLHGDQFSRKQVRDLLDQINENSKDGGRLVFA